MELKLVRHLWGVPEPFSEAAFARFRKRSYSGIELFMKGYADAGKVSVRDVKELCESQDFLVILQVLTEGNSVEAHLRSLRQQIATAAPLQPCLINIHSGRDAFTEAQSVRYFTESQKMEMDGGTPFAHETHRGRILYNPWTTRRMLEQFPDLKLVCDFSHWVCVCERLIDDLLDIIRLCAERCVHLHARVGYECGPQVADPRAPEFAPHLEAHERWWTLVWDAQRRRGDTVSTLCPEFGPRPYQQELPCSQTPTSDLGAICDWQAERQSHRFTEYMGKG